MRKLVYQTMVTHCVVLPLKQSLSSIGSLSFYEAISRLKEFKNSQFNYRAQTQRIQTTLLSGVARDTDERYEGESDHGLPDLHPARRDKPEDHQQPDEGQHGVEDGHQEHRIGLDLSCLTRRNHTDAEGGQTSLSCQQI